MRHRGRIVPLTGGANLGITGNSNRALRACRGKYIAFLGGDDVLLPGKISKQVEWLESDSTRVLCGHQVDVFYMSGKKSTKYQRAMFLAGGRGASKVIRFGVPYCACSIMLRSAAIPPHGFDERIPHCSDHMMWAECLAAGGRYGHVPGTYARYRRHSANITNGGEKLFHEIKTILDLFSLRYPAYKKDCAYAMGSLLQYGYGYASLQEGDYGQAIRRLITAIKIYPHHWKAWARLTQAMLRGALKIAKFQ